MECNLCHCSGGQMCLAAWWQLGTSISELLVSHPDTYWWEGNTALPQQVLQGSWQYRWENAFILNISTSDQAVRMHSPILSLTSELLDSPSSLCGSLWNCDQEHSDQMMTLFRRGWVKRNVGSVSVKWSGVYSNPEFGKYSILQPSRQKTPKISICFFSILATF